MTKSYKPDIGTVVSLNTGTVITGASAVSIEVRKPSGLVETWAGVIGSDTYSVEHTIAAGNLTEAGIYILQAKVVIGSGTWYGDSVSYEVKNIWN